MFLISEVPLYPFQDAGVVKAALEVVVVKEFVVEVEEVLLFSLSSTPTPRTTPSTRLLVLSLRNIIKLELWVHGTILSTLERRIPERYPKP